MRDLLVRGVVRPLYDAQRRVRASTRAAIRARDAGLRFRRAARDWPQDRRRRWVLERLRVVLREADEVEFYRERFRAVGFDPAAPFGFEDFARLPVLERSELRSAGDTVRRRGLDPGTVRLDATGGSTGTPTEVWKGPEERGWGEAGQAFYMARIGAPPGTRTAYLWGHHLDPVASDRWGDRLRTLVGNGRWYDCFRISPERLAGYHQDLQRWRPGSLVAYASALGALARAVRDHDLAPPRYPTRCFVTGAEKLEGPDRRVIEEVYGRPVHERYGSRDVGLIGFQVAPARSLDFEIDWANVLVEPEGPGAEGAVLVTKLHGDAMPMIRYRIGDLARFPTSASPGHPAWRLHEVMGRDMDRVWLPDGRWLHAVALPHLMKDHPIQEFRLEQEADFSIAVLVVPAPGFTEATAASIEAVIRSNVPGVPVTVVRRESLDRTPSGKRRPVISRAAPQMEKR